MVDIHEYYEQYWQSPEDYNDPTTPQRMSLLRQHTASLPLGAQILDAGCGRGEFCAFFRDLGFAPQGIDISQTVIEFARTQHPGIAFHRGELQSMLPQHAGTFGCVFSSEVIEHLFDVNSYLQTAHGLLESEGILIVTTPYHGLIKNIAIDLAGYSRHYDPVGQHIRFFDRKGLLRCLHDSGFEARVLTGYGRPWPFWKSFFAVCRKR